MPKIKSIKSCSKRFFKTTSGNFKHRSSNLNHILTKKSKKRKRHLSCKKIIASQEKRRVSICLPHQ